MDKLFTLIKVTRLIVLLSLHNTPKRSEERIQRIIKQIFPTEFTTHLNIKNLKSNYNEKKLTFS